MVTKPKIYKTAPTLPPPPKAPAKPLLDMTPQDLKASSPTSFNYLDNLLTHLDDLKAQVTSGKLPLIDYINKADVFAKTATDTLNDLTTKGSNSADQAKNRLSHLRQYATLDTSTGQGGYKDVKVPFNGREMAALPQNVLPSQAELQKANIPFDMFPSGTPFRVDPKPAITPQINPGNQPGAQPGGQPNTTFNPGSLTRIPDPSNPGQFINIPVVGDPLSNSVTKSMDQVTIEQEAARQAEQQRQAFDAKNAIASDNMSKLRDLLTQQNTLQYNQDKPGIYEDLNSNGLLRSSGLGEALARESAKLTANTNNTLSQQALSDNQRQIGDINTILGQQQGFQTSGLERNFSLADYQNEINNAKMLGSQVTPTVRTNTQGGVLSGVLGGSLGGAGSGAAIGSVVPGIGTALGAGLGAVLGGAGGAAKAGGK